MLKESQIKDDSIMLTISGELDLRVADKLRTEIDKIIDKSNKKNYVFNFEDVNFIDSSGLGVLLGRYKKLHSQGGKISIINVQPQVMRILELSGITNLIEVSDLYPGAMGGN